MMESKKRNITPPKKKKREFHIYPAAARDIFDKCFQEAGLVYKFKNTLQDDGWRNLTIEIKRRSKEYPAIAYDLKFYWEPYTVRVYNVNQESNQLNYNFDWDDYHNDLRDLFRRICIMNDSSDLARVRGFQKPKLIPLLLYIGIKDHGELDKLNESFKPAEHTAEQNGKSEITSDKNEITDNELVENTVVAEPDILPVVFMLKPFRKFNPVTIPDDIGYCYFYEDKYCEFVGEDYNVPIRKDTSTTVSNFPAGNDPDPLWIKIEYDRDGILQTAYFAQYELFNNELKLKSPESLKQRFNKLSIPSENI